MRLRRPPQRSVTDNLRFLRALLTRPKHVGAVAPSSRMLARAIADEVDPSRPGPVLELGPGTGVITQALLERGVAPERLTTIEYRWISPPASSRAFPVPCDPRAMSISAALWGRGMQALAAIVSGVPLLFPVARRLRLYVKALMQLSCAAGAADSVSYGMHAPRISIQRSQRASTTADLGQPAASM